MPTNTFTERIIGNLGFHKRSSKIIKTILAGNIVLFSTIYIIILLLLNRLGYNLIPKTGFYKIAHAIGIGFIAVIFNEELLIKYLKKK